jgi:valyl-tRNA synthetase
MKLDTTSDKLSAQSELTKLEKKLKKLQENHESLREQMNKPDYAQRVPPRILELNNKTFQTQQKEIAELEKSIATLHTRL